MKPTVGLYLIVRNEEQRLSSLLESVIGAFDQIVLVDTGSRDKTVSIFRAWAKEHGENVVVEHFKWVKDFAAAREYAQSLLTTDWEVWADADDILYGAKNLRDIAAQAPDEVAGYIAGYNYTQHPANGACICYLKRERLVRRGKGKWVNRVHEAQMVDGPVMQLDPGLVEWKHFKIRSEDDMEEVGKSTRNLDILEDWVKDEPENTRVLAYLGSENLVKGKLEEAIGYFSRYIGLDAEWTEERAQVYRKYAMAMMMKGQFDTAIELAMEALKLLPSWPDSYLTLAEAYHSKGEHEKAVEWARETLRRGAPDCFLIINPQDYTYQPRKILSGSLAELGAVDEAIKVGTEAWQINPNDQALVQGLYSWRRTAKSEHTANTVAMMCEQLIAHDEQAKALTLIEECVPHFVDDHPRIVALRSQLRERLMWVHDPDAFQEHYAVGGSKPEDFLDDETADKVAAQLPRVTFLALGIKEQLEEQHINAEIDRMMPQAVAMAQESLGG